MYPGDQAKRHPDKPAFIMATDGTGVSYSELDYRACQLAHFFRAQGLLPLDHYAILVENQSHFIECCAAGERSGLYFTCINTHLIAEEIAYILRNSESKLLITSRKYLDVARAALEMTPDVRTCLVIGGEDENAIIRNYVSAITSFPGTPIEDERLGTAMLYSSGTTGQPKGILRPLPDVQPSHPLPVYAFFETLLQLDSDTVLLSPAPLYHSAPNTSVGMTVRVGGTSIIMDRFDAETFLALIERYRVTHVQLVPTMFSRLLKLPADVREKYDLSSLRFAVHAAAPCPPQVKEAMIEWWGPIIHEYYGATESIGFTACDSAEWQSHPGTVGRVLFGDLHILDDDMQPVPLGTAGTIWFKTDGAFEYFRNPEKTAEVRSPDGTMSTTGDVGYLDADGFLYLTDRKSFLIISGGVNIYPQECENVLVSHPSVTDAAVFGVPNPDLGEEVKAVVQLVAGVEPSAELAEELIAFCMQQIARYKCPRSIDFRPELPRSPTGKLFKRLLRDEYWAAQPLASA